MEKHGPNHQPVSDLSQIGWWLVERVHPKRARNVQETACTGCMGKTATARPADVIPKPSRLTPPRAEGRVTDSGDARVLQCHYAVQSVYIFQMAIKHGQKYS